MKKVLSPNAAMALAGASAAVIGWCLMGGCKDDDYDPYAEPPKSKADDPWAGLPIDDYAPNDPARVCKPIAQPGAKMLRQFVRDRWGERAGSPENIVRSCSGPSTVNSEHHEGRAWDWMVPSLEQGNKVAEALLASDAAGNPHALARRLGIQYMIWNRRMWRAYPHAAGTRVWSPYTGPNPHTDHIHFSLSWPGARGETSAYRNFPSV